MIIDNKKDEAFRLINSISINNEAQLQIINYNQLLAYVYFNEYEQAKTLYENMEFSNFLFDSESALALVQYFQKTHAYQIETIPGIKDMIAKYK